MREVGIKRRQFWRVLPAFIFAFAMLVVIPAPAFADPPTKLPSNAPGADLTYQPAFDYDRDSCYPTPAIGNNGVIAPGLPIAGAVNGSCRDPWDLDNTNSYSRSKCNGNWCAYMYALYFEKDQTVAGVGGQGHRHDIEHVVVWVRNGNKYPEWVSVSQHDGFAWRHRNSIQWDSSGTHPKMVYNKDAGTHFMRFANAGEQPENHRKAWQYPTLVGWNGFPSDFRDRLMNHDFGKAEFRLKDGNFSYWLGRAKPAEVTNFVP